jgi:hypothetical protein
MSRVIMKDEQSFFWFQKAKGNQLRGLMHRIPATALDLYMHYYCMKLVPNALKICTIKLLTWGSKGKITNP